MNSETEKNKASARPPDWRAEVCTSFNKLEDVFTEPQVLQGEWPYWMTRAIQEILKAYLPEARLKVGAEWTSRELGGVLGAKVGVLQWLTDENGFAKSKTFLQLQRLADSLPPEIANAPNPEFEKLWEMFEKYVEEFETAKAAIFVAVTTADPREQAEFFEAYSAALQRIANGVDGSNTGTTATPIYIVLVLGNSWVRHLNSIPELHRICQSLLGKSCVGSLKTFEKLCQRIKLKLRPPGRPRKKR